MNAWYATLRRPPLTPPDGVFAPVWTALYLMIALAIVLYYRAPLKPRVRRTTAVLAVHLAANAAWTSLFFGLRSPAWALADILLLDVTLGMLVVWVWRARAAAGVLLVPYAAWVLFATYLNAGFYWLNR